ncbi:MAG TPA: TetR/AcrR family transcriptional regulator [Galbitalea sp.]|jgi:AcrR family transcriptional regulator|nr:TetR/AcrR family transcriptional regulator [Galbitalea sp.]
MAARGAYAKGVAKRDEILTTALDVIARHGYRNASIRELAAAVGLSQTGLLHYFDTKEQLFVEVLRKRDEVDAATFGAPIDQGSATPDIVEGMIRVVRHNADVPGLVQLYAQFSTEAAEPGHPARDFFLQRYAAFREMVSSAIREKQAASELSPTLDPDRIANLLLAASDGLQTQWMLDDSIDMADHIAYLWERLTGE